MRERFRRYLDRHADTRPADQPIPDDCRMVVVIPVHNEPELSHTLTSLAQCTPPQCKWRAVLVINDCCDDPETVRQQNQRTLAILQNNPSPCPVSVIDATGLESGKAGVGTARKIGMDSAVAAFARSNHDGILLSLDADCTVNRDYLVAVARYFTDHPRSPACVTDFHHPLDKADNAAARKAMVQYELHLRYYRLGLQYAAVPYAFSTIGSCFACRASDYIRQGGMNRRQAGEDFYFLHKMARLGTIDQCHHAIVYPSPRATSRTPFGTGQAIASWMESGATAWESYHPQAFSDLATMVAQIDTMYTDGIDLPLPPSMQRFFRQQQATNHLAEIRRNTATLATFRKRFWHWFDGFLAMKFIRFACNELHGWLPVEAGLHRLLQTDRPHIDAESLLMQLRETSIYLGHQHDIKKESIEY